MFVSRTPACIQYLVCCDSIRQACKYFLLCLSNLFTNLLESILLYEEYISFTISGNVKNVRCIISFWNFGQSYGKLYFLMVVEQSDSVRPDNKYSTNQKQLCPPIDRQSIGNRRCLPTQHLDIHTLVNIKTRYNKGESHR